MNGLWGIASVDEVAEVRRGSGDRRERPGARCTRYRRERRMSSLTRHASLLLDEEEGD